MIDNNYETVFIVDNFDGSIFQQLQRAGCRIVAPPVILRCAMYGEVSVAFVRGLPRAALEVLWNNLMYLTEPWSNQAMMLQVTWKIRLCL